MKQKKIKRCKNTTFFCSMWSWWTLRRRFVHIGTWMASWRGPVSCWTRPRLPWTMFWRECCTTWAKTAMHLSPAATSRRWWACFSQMQELRRSTVSKGTCRLCMCVCGGGGRCENTHNTSIQSQAQYDREYILLPTIRPRPITCDTWPKNIRRLHKHLPVKYLPLRLRSRIVRQTWEWFK